MNVRAVSVCAVSLLAGAVIAFFGAGPMLFADGSFGERVAVFLVTAVLYFVIGAAAGAIARDEWKWAGACLAVGLVPILIVFGGDALSQPWSALMAAAFVLGDAAAALGGALVGARLWQRFRGPAD
jgi:hypothetical protein